MRKLLGCLFVLMVVPMSVHALEIEGVTLPETKQLGEKSLMLNGAGTRSKFFLDLYVGSLYLQSKSSNASRVVSADEAMSIRLDIVSSFITAEKMTKATLEGFEDSTGGNMSAIKPQIDQFLSAFKEDINEGDSFEFIYEPNKGVLVLKNDVNKGVIEGLAFKQALFGIWLSDDSVQTSLKEDMLGE
ncbi:MAG: chalcone isomerase [Piscirickettsiaceae bacterium]|nr:MAG: chalcone isomerase [Piscirickettsiaceae bacterium]